MVLLSRNSGLFVGAGLHSRLLRGMMMSSDSGFDMSLLNRKGLLRNTMRKTLKSLPEENIQRQSVATCQRVLALDGVQQAKGVCTYLSMPTELQTAPLLTGLFNERYMVVSQHSVVGEDNARAVFVPKVLGEDRLNMVVLPVMGGSAEIDSYPRNKWNIPEPEVPIELTTDELWELAVPLVDVVVVPGLAFDTACRRLGRGRGYYDTFLETLMGKRDSLGLPPPLTIGVCLEEQIVPEVPAAPHDRVLDAVVTSEATFRRADH